MDKLVLTVILVAWGISLIEVVRSKNIWVFITWLILTATLYLTIDVSIQLRRLYE